MVTDPDALQISGLVFNGSAQLILADGKTLTIEHPSQAPNCTGDLTVYVQKEGEKTFTAAFENTAFETQTKTETIPVTSKEEDGSAGAGFKILTSSGKSTSAEKPTK